MTAFLVSCLLIAAGLHNNFCLSFDRKVTNFPATLQYIHILQQFSSELQLPTELCTLHELREEAFDLCSKICQYLMVSELDGMYW